MNAMVKLKVGNPVTGKNFIGREEEIKYIIQLLQLGQNIVLIAPRRYGKTSLVLEILSKIHTQKQYTAFIDFFSVPSLKILSSQITESVLKNRKLDKIFTKTKNSALAMIQNLKMKATIEDFEFIIEFSNQKENDWELLEKSIDFIDHFPEKYGMNMVCAFDEFGDLKKLDGNKIVKLFRSRLQRHENSTYIFSGSYESVMSGLFIEQKAPFYRFARVIHLGKIGKNKFLKFYKSQLDAQKINYDDKLLTKILDFTDGHPYYSQLALQEIIIYYALNNKNPDFKEIIDSMLNAEKNYLEKSWEELSKRKELLKTALVIAENNRNIYSSLKNSGINISRSLKSLTMNGILVKTPTKYEFTDPLFKHWIEINVLRKYN